MSKKQNCTAMSSAEA
ncbi:hypothetical protein Tco_0732400, partial [Tanacetum coccineum]